MDKKTASRDRGGLGTNPLDALVPSVLAKSNESRLGIASTGTTPRREKPAKNRYTLHLPVDLMERAKNAAYWTPGLTLAGLVAVGLRAELEALEKKHGGPFNVRERELVGGRPFGS